MASSVFQYVLLLIACSRCLSRPDNSALPTGTSVAFVVPDDENSTWEGPQLPTGYVRSRDVGMLWNIPFPIALLSFWTFPFISSVFHVVAQWASSNTWFPHTQEGVNLQANVVVRRVENVTAQSSWTLLTDDHY
jgi:hypothetical protein